LAFIFTPDFCSAIVCMIPENELQVLKVLPSAALRCASRPSCDMIDSNFASPSCAPSK
jgi:hypothetical protein